MPPIPPTRASVFFGRSAVRRRSEQPLPSRGTYWLKLPSRRIPAQRCSADCWQRLARLPWTAIPLRHRRRRMSRILAAPFCCSAPDWRLCWPLGGGSGRIRESLAERRFPNRLRARGWFSGHFATVGHGKPVWKPALRGSTKNSRMRPTVLFPGLTPCQPGQSSLNIKRQRNGFRCLASLYARLPPCRTGYTAWLTSSDRISRQNFPIGRVRPCSQF